MEATKGYITPNDKKSKANKYTTRSYSSNVRKARVRPDGLGPTATRNSDFFRRVFDLPPYKDRVENSAFYEIKSGGTTLSLNYSEDNPKQLWAMLDVLSRNEAVKYGNATLFLITPSDVNIAPDLINKAREYRVNLVQITPVLLSNGQISFKRVKYKYIVPQGGLHKTVGAIVETESNPMFHRPVNLIWK